MSRTFEFDPHGSAATTPDRSPTIGNGNGSGAGRAAADQPWTRLGEADYARLVRRLRRSVFLDRLTAHLGVPSNRAVAQTINRPAFERANTCATLALMIDPDAVFFARRTVSRDSVDVPPSPTAAAAPPELRIGPRRRDAGARSNGTQTIELVDDFHSDYRGTDAASLRTESLQLGDLDLEIPVAGTLLIRADGEPLAIHLDWEDPDDDYETLRLFGPATPGGIAALNAFIADLTRRVEHEPIWAGHAITAHGRGIRHGRHGWDELILAPDKLAALRRNTSEMIRRLPVYRRNRLPLKRGLILAGPPGTGKTLAGKVLASELAGLELPWPAPDAPDADPPSTRRVTFVWVGPADIGEPANVAAVFQMARRAAPAVLFFEDMDLYIRDRAGDGGNSNPILGEFLNQLDGPVGNDGIITILTTNYLDTLESALKDRPGRFDRTIHFAEPDADARRRLLQRYTAGMNLGRLSFKRLAAQTDGMTGAQLREVITAAAVAALEDDSLGADGRVKLMPRHFTQAINGIAKPTDERIGFVA
jgi:hypothetical protein